VSVVVAATPFPIVQQPLPKADPCVIVIFGALGDLTKRKLVPALFHLPCAGSLSGRFKVRGIGRQPMNDEQFRAEMRKGATGAKEMGEFSDAEWQAFATRLHYLPGDVSEVETYLRIAARLEQIASEESASANHNLLSGNAAVAGAGYRQWTRRGGTGFGTKRVVAHCL
jgi:glucose-6-phosphate 1-dehydrogenase